jgi:replication factor A1
LTISIDDANGQLFVNMFDELTSKVFGITAEQFMSLKEADESAADNMIHTILFHTFNFNIRARTEQFKVKK